MLTRSDVSATSDLNTNDKGNILNAYATILSDNSTGRVSMFFGLDREAQNGAATVGYWFFQDGRVGLGSAVGRQAYAFNGQHMDGKPCLSTPLKGPPLLQALPDSDVVHTFYR